MRVLVCKNIKKGAKSTLEDYLSQNNIEHTVIDLANGQKLPDIDDYNILVILGGYMSAFEGELYPFLNDQIKAVQVFYEQNKKVLGLCLGAQIISLALGGEVFNGNIKELGWKDLTFDPFVFEDPFLKAITCNGKNKIPCETIKVLEWHGDTFTLPKGAQLIGSTKLYSHQGFKLSNNAYALQFHLEVSKEMIQEWVKISEVDAQKVLKDTDLYLSDFQKRSHNFYKAFFMD